MTAVAASRSPDTSSALSDAASEALVDEVHRRVIDAMAEAPSPLSANTPDIVAMVRMLAPLAGSELVDDVVARVSARVNGLGPLEPLFADASVSEVMINGPGPVWVERNGALSLSGVSLDRAAVDLVIERIVAPLGRRVDQLTPCVDGRLPDGSRVHVTVPPVAVDGPYVTIRRFVVADVALEMFAAPPVVALLEELVDRGANLVVSGGTGAGKTTLLNALAGRVSPVQRVITIEDAAELQLKHPHVVRLEARPESREGGGAVTIRELVRNALRMRPDRMVVGEVRGPEALDLLHALNTGHAGCLATVHANGPVDALRRLAALATAADERLGVKAVRGHLTAAIDAVVHLGRAPDGSRRLAAVGEVTAHDRVRLLADAGEVHAPISRGARLAVRS
ncbi:MAG: ATPase, T2SS/T4P/T4SS family [Acidimicrobiaceae bacterium]|nr:ATPase, T2SS/T4P/T4SS family [Acidimicrobiaceae bacterium]MCY4175826.1 ATPase, T2SS/T4P/T4SS family [Acidimicrobiaceae bacterium]MCY4280935.1 ATPase, T2SS/T4P/T4SS family [Acidimicrobiaceae bacterium]MCY4294797.1 ATPase, T2SS/T4P/T4SS family [Acidimicrobiaceae bacterium]